MVDTILCLSLVAWVDHYKLLMVVFTYVSVLWFLLGASAATPRALWSLYYNMELCNVNQEILAGTPTNLYLTSDPTNKIVYNEAGVTLSGM